MKSSAVTPFSSVHLSQVKEKAAVEIAGPPPTEEHESQRKVQEMETFKMLLNLTQNSLFLMPKSF